MRLVLVDNHDSYTFNLAALLESAGAQVAVLSNDDEALLTVTEVDGIVISPGPGSPLVAADVGHAPALLARLPDVPVLGVCLGHQLLAVLHGGGVTAVEPAHGRVSTISHLDTGLLAGLPQGFAATRYHSLAVTDPGPHCGFSATAWAEDGMVMALEVTDRPRWGIQFHPESVETPLGEQIVAAFLASLRPVVLRRGVRGPFDPAVLFPALYGAEPLAFWLDGPTTYLGTGEPGDPADHAAPDLSEPLPGGVVGYRTYEGRNHWLRVERVLALAEGDAELRALPGTGAMEWLESTAAALEPLRGRVADIPVADVPPAVPRATRSRAEYLADVALCKAHLARGESYEICLTNRLRLDPVADPLALHLQIRARTPTGRSAYLRMGEVAICSATPETFLTVTPGGQVTARPIKGTAARHLDPVADARARTALGTDPKTRAENLMIVDLLRNDLHRVCEPDSVTVPRYLEVESYATVHQLVSTISGRLRPGITALDALEAAFPPGSMTGAPKERTMAILAKLEPEPRGIYSGVLGILGGDGSADLSVIIRTAVCSPQEVSIGVGGAIVWASDPQDEYAETMLKARALLEAYTAVQLCPPIGYFEDMTTTPSEPSPDSEVVLRGDPGAQPNRDLHPGDDRGAVPAAGVDA